MVYIGKDKYIQQNKRHKDHNRESRYDEQVINRIVQNTPSRYDYYVLKDNLSSNAEAIYWERTLIGLFETEDFWNFTSGGEGTVGYKWTEEQKQRRSEAMKELWSDPNSAFHSEERYQKISEAMKGNKYMLGKHHTEESKNKMSESHKILWTDDERRQKQSEAMKGKHHTEESKKKNSLTTSRQMNKTGLYRVTKQYKRNCKQRFCWAYRYYDNGKHKGLSSTNLHTLKQKVLDADFDWQILDDNKALKTILTDLIAKVPPENRVKVHRNI